MRRGHGLCQIGWEFARQGEGESIALTLACGVLRTSNVLGRPIFTGVRAFVRRSARLTGIAAARVGSVVPLTERVGLASILGGLCICVLGTGKIERDGQVAQLTDLLA